MRKNAPTLDSLFPTVRQGVLAATLTRPEKWWYLSELAEFLHTRPSSLQRELSSLGREVNLTSYSVDEFRKKVAEGDHFLATVLEGDLQFVKGEQGDLDAVVGK